jgi:hypothetical protein
LIRALPLLLLASFPLGSAQHSTHDPAFEKVPFDQWLTERNLGPFHWTAGVPRVELSFHQRLLARIEIHVDGRDLQNRRADGQLVFLFQITDHDGIRYQNHGVVELSKLDENVKAATIGYSQRAFFRPGDYRLAVAILDTGTGEHGTREAQFRAPPAPREFLASAWRGLPTVEFLGKEDPPDDWFLPEVQGRIQWAAGVQTAARLNVILNITPHGTHSGDMAALLPTLKAITETGSSAITERVELLDLSRRRAAFDSTGTNPIDWPPLKDALGDSNTASIDVHSLSQRHEDARFFVGQIRAVLRASQAPCVLVVLTAPVSFESGEDLSPISTEALPACRVVYIRYRAQVIRDRPPDPAFGGHGRGGSRMGGPMSHARPVEEIDQLENTLKPLNPKVFDVDNPEEITKALMEIEKDLK